MSEIDKILKVLDTASNFLPAGEQAIKTVNIVSNLIVRVKNGEEILIEEVEKAFSDSLQITESLKDSIKKARLENKK